MILTEHTFRLGFFSSYSEKMYHISVVNPGSVDFKHDEYFSISNENLDEVWSKNDLALMN